MRKSYKYNIKCEKKIINQIILKSKNYSFSSVLLSNYNLQKPNMPEKYISYDCIVMFDMIDTLLSNSNSFEKLSVFHNNKKDWLFGSLSYDLKNELEQLSSNNNDEVFAPDLFFFVPKYVLLLKEKQIEILSHESKKNVDSFFKLLVSLKQKNDIINTKINVKKRENKSQYLKKINAIKKNIQRGDIYEMNYCLDFFSKNVDLNCEDLFLKVNNYIKNPFSAFIHMKDYYILSASPERFLKKSGQDVLSQPIKGTLRRGLNEDEDNKLLDEFKNSYKDISENVMITDLVRNDLSIDALKSTVRVKELSKIYTFEKVHQMISTITSKVDAKCCFTKLLKSTFPMGSMTGAPKLKSMELIEKYENFKRGFYSGSIGYVTPESDFDFNVIIRSIVYNAKTKYLSIGVGGAITINSVAEKEYEECLVKIQPILDIIDDK